jgi:hypothetical protein
MEQYLTNGNKSIPKLIAVDENGNELFQWGPRPEPAQKVFEEHLNEDPSKQKSKQAVDTWYARDLCRTFELEMAERLKKVGS